MCNSYFAGHDSEAITDYKRNHPWGRWLYEDIVRPPAPPTEVQEAAPAEEADKENTGKRGKKRTAKGTPKSTGEKEKSATPKNKNATPKSAGKAAPKAAPAGKAAVTEASKEPEAAPVSKVRAAFLLMMYA